jgi:general secretion pathway protein G
MRGLRNGKGFTLLELLVVVGIIGILTTIAINNFYNAVQRSRQKRTMADMRSIAVAWEARAVDMKQYNAAAATLDMPPAKLTFAQVDALLVPTYIQHIPDTDGWGAPLDFATDFAIGSGRGAGAYAMRSGGRDKAFTGDTYQEGGTTDFDCDIVYMSGQFIVWPQGTQSH